MKSKTKYWDTWNEILTSNEPLEEVLENVKVVVQLGSNKSTLALVISNIWWMLRGIIACKKDEYWHESRHVQCLNWQVTLGIPLVLKIRRQSKVSGLSIRTCLASVATMTNSSRIWINIGSADGSMDFFKIKTPFSVLLIFRSWLIA